MGNWFRKDRRVGEEISDEGLLVALAAEQLLTVAAVCHLSSGAEKIYASRGPLMAKSSGEGILVELLRVGFSRLYSWGEIEAHLGPVHRPQVLDNLARFEIAAEALDTGRLDGLSIYGANFQLTTQMGFIFSLTTFSDDGSQMEVTMSIPEVWEALEFLAKETKSQR